MSGEVGSLRPVEQFGSSGEVAVGFFEPADPAREVLQGHRPQGLVREQTFDAVQPKFTLRYKPTENMTFYGGWGRGFRS